MGHYTFRRALAGVAVLSVALAGCSKRDKTDDAATDTSAGEAVDADTASSASAAATPGAVPPNQPGASEAEINAPLAVADVDRYERGLKAEIQAVRDAQEAKRQAKTANDTMNVYMVSQRVDSIGAAAAGVEISRYRSLKARIQGVVNVLHPMVPIDTSQIPAKERETYRLQTQRVYEGVPKDVVDALKPRAEALSKLPLQLAGELFKVAS